jgi:hypothetical protein
MENNMTRQEAAIVSAYTGILIGKFSDLHRYIETLLDRPVFTHELADDSLFDKIKAKAKKDFISLEVK